MTQTAWRAALPTVVIVAVCVALGACGGGSSPAVAGGGDPARGRERIAYYGCGSCHQISGVHGADGHVGPPLTTLAGRRYIAGLLPATAGNIARWIQHPQQIKPGTIMPDLGVTKRDARDITAYLLSGQ
jgi:cytochrome c